MKAVNKKKIYTKKEDKAYQKWLRKTKKEREGMSLLDAMVWLEG
jgi:hypothetical protein